MKSQTKINLFTRYSHYWIVKLELDKKYKIIIKKDNRISDRAYIYRCSKTGAYIIKYSTKLLTNRVEILHTLLHELGHLFYDFRFVNGADHEYRAELFALQTIKEHYPKYYDKAIRQVKEDLSYKHQDKIHVEGYTKALIELGELDGS